MAKRFYRVQGGDRPDLAAIGSTSQLDVRGYVFPKIFPLMPVTEQTGTMSVAPAGLTDAKGVKNRADGAALNGGTIKRIDVNWSAARIEGRAKIYEKDGSAYTSAEATDNAGAEDAQRQAWNLVESDAHDKVFTAARMNAATELADHAVVKTIQKLAKGLRKYGTPTLVMTTNTWFDFVEIPEIRDRFAKLAGAGNDIGYIMTDVEKVRAAVSTFLSIGDILLFDSAIVGAASDGKIAVIGLRKIQGDVYSTAKDRALYGFAPIYIPEGAPNDKPFDMRAWYDDANKANVYDAEAYIGIVEAFGESGDNKPGSAVAMAKLAEAYTEYTSIVTQQA